MDRLPQLLEQVLPKSPDKAIKGTELVPLLRNAGLREDEWTDESLRSRFSQLVRQETSVIAKRVGQHGYYLRPEVSNPSEAPSTQEQEGDTPRTRDDQGEEKFRSIFMAWCEREGELPVHIEHTNANRQTAGLNLWKFPDVVSLRWDVLNNDDRGRPILDQAILDVRKTLGEQPFRISSTELKVELTAGTLRQVFFQCVSNSRWAHNARLVVATDILDEALASEIQRLGASYGVSVTTFSLTKEDLSRLPPANKIQSADQVEEKLGRKLSVTTVVSAAEKDFLDWEHIKDMQEQHDHFRKIFRWIAKSIADYRPHSFDHWLEHYG
ncbi:MAG: hypothetical protein JNL81_03300 [Hyphomonadaceae bacterium]|nr:hypothetical protein [Hyphomonadaceae bacterium]